MPPPEVFSLILFDLGQVILPFDIRIATRKMGEASPLSSEEIVHAILGTPLDRAFEEGKITPNGFYEEVKKRVGLRMPFPHFVEAWNDIFSENQKVSAIVRELLKRFRVAIISNTNILHFEYVFQKFPIVREVGHFILSYQIGARKPVSAIYESALNRFQTLPQKTLYIDDRVDFILAARSLGLHGVHFEGEEPLEKELRALWVLTG